MQFNRDEFKGLAIELLAVGLFVALFYILTLIIMM